MKMKKLSNTQKLIFVLGVVGTIVGLVGKFNNWDHGDYFPIFYAGMSFMWIAFLKPETKCCNLFKRRTSRSSI
ncbi:hypothetical protein M3P19_00270 [Muricauda sp. 2012CJ35-5]|uniref:DUF3098 domain-containing protein n=1 Tax=Flagellimonas spongiicola TaxID=2942208 RepID=A0ABT0PM19_9FLAO|nr:hypothetical protein [Allomuricauda spongiicola]MCL6272417.1 hypothetical protein [Allomuricauda spongiicola]